MTGKRVFWWTRRPLVAARLQCGPMQIYAEMMQMFESGTFDIAHIDSRLRSFTIVTE